jgi:hypothetical protein
MNFIIIYISEDFINKNFLEESFNYMKVYLNYFNLIELIDIIKNYEYIIYLNDETNYDFSNLIIDIEKSKEVIIRDASIEQILFYNLDYNNIDKKIIDNDINYIINEITILENKEKYKKTNINYNHYVDNNFNRLFVPSIISTKKLLKYNDILKNQKYYEFNFLKNGINRHIINQDINYEIIEKIEYKNNINDDLTIVTGFLKLNEKKIQKYEYQKYEYLEECIKTLKININMVIFISDELYDFIYEKRKEFNLLEKTKIIKIDIEKNMYFYNNLEKIEENVKKNHNIYKNAKKILSVVSRYNYLKYTIENNYFNSKYIAWLDFSAGHIVDIPNNIIFNDNFNNQIKIAWIARIKNNKFVYNYKFLAGGFFIGKCDIILELIKCHHTQFELLMNLGFTINDDKLLFFIYEKYPYLFKTFLSDYKHILLKL